MKNLKKMLSAIFILTCGFFTIGSNVNAQTEKMESALTKEEKSEGNFRQKGSIYKKDRQLL